MALPGRYRERRPGCVSKRIDSAPLKVEVSQASPAEIDADLVVVGLYEGGSLPEQLADAGGAGDARGGYRKLAVLHPQGGGRALAVGLGKREEMDAERARVAAALAAKRAAELEAASVAWLLPESDEEEAIAEGIVTGTILGAYRFDRFKSADPDDPPPPGIESLTLLGPEAVAEAAEAARICAEAQNRARDLQSLPSNVATPSYLGRRAREVAVASREGHHRGVRPRLAGREGDGRHPRRQPGVGGGAAADRPALRGRRRRAHPGPGRQGRHLRHRRDLDQALRRHARDEDGHVGRRRGPRGGDGDRRARPRRRPRRGHPLDREHALGHGGQAR